MNDYRYIEVKLKDCSDLFKIQQSSLSRFVFRGQGSEKWPLETSIRRMITRYHTEAVDPRKFDDYERAMLKEFKWKYPGYQLNTNMVPDQDNDVEWLSLMQHYGAKTRLLDFSYSIYVALYMAIYGLAGWAQEDAALLDDCEAERTTMDAILSHLKRMDIHWSAGTMAIFITHGMARLMACGLRCWTSWNCSKCRECRKFADLSLKMKKYCRFSPIYFDIWIFFCTFAR